MEAAFLSQIADELSLRQEQVAGTVRLLSEDATVPFIARYRKEVTGNLDETQIIAVRDRLERLRELEKRRAAILKSLTDQEKLTSELERKITDAPSLAVLEDIYLPFRPKRRTKAAMAREKGLEPLARIITDGKMKDLQGEAEKYIDHEKGVMSAEEALQGAREIIAEEINENAEVRGKLRTLFEKRAVVATKVVKGKEQKGSKYRDYFSWEEPAEKAPSHRILALFRGAEEGILSLHILPEEAEALKLIGKIVSEKTYSPPFRDHIGMSILDGYRRLLAPSLENEMKQVLKKRADSEAIRVFAENVKELLLSPPLGEKNVLAVDPGFRTGCKVVCLDRQGNLTASETIYPLEPQNRTREAAEVLTRLAEEHGTEAIAVGNGTGGREALSFCEGLDFTRPLVIVSVNESGASVYSASETAREEFPDRDVTVRGAVSIGRRLMDPLAELVKIDPKSIGVGQYQHDVDQKALKKSLDDVVSSCVNAVGVEVNTASKELLRYVAGLSARTAGKIVSHRASRGPFKSRKQLLGVEGMGPKTYEQAAGFLRIRDGENPLDASAVHPERYPLVDRMAADLGCSVSDLLSDPEKRRRIHPEDYVTSDAGLPTLKDIFAELAKPGRDPRKKFEAFRFSEDVHSPEDLKEGMVLPGIVTNVTNFGAFVDIGVHQDGLVHISELSDSFVRTPYDIVKVSQKVTVRVLTLDLERGRIGLSMRDI